MKPCPFCGGEAVVRGRAGYDYGTSECWVQCKECNVRTRSQHSGGPLDSMTNGQAEKFAKQTWERRT